MKTHEVERKHCFFDTKRTMMLLGERALGEKARIGGTFFGKLTSSG